MQYGDLAVQTQAERLPKPYLSTFSRDLSLGAGTQSVTGVGFKPSYVIFFGDINSSDYATWGFDIGSAESGIEAFGDTDNFASFAGGGQSIRFSTSGAGFDIGAAISSLDTDGFTITWAVLGGSPTGTAVMIFAAYK